jgi:hypothetical protein
LPSAILPDTVSIIEARDGIEIDLATENKYVFGAREGQKWPDGIAI